jgi:HEAT repeats
MRRSRRAFTARETALHRKNERFPVLLPATVTCGYRVIHVDHRQAACARRDNPWPGRPAGAIVGTVGRWRKIAEQAGVGLPAGEGRTARDAIDGLLELSRSPDSLVRQLACRNLCTCHVRADDDRIWGRLLELLGDPDPGVRGDVIHAITDSTPAPRVPAVIQALESRHNDPDARIRRQVRKVLAHYRRTGKVTDAAR